MESGLSARRGKLLAASMACSRCFRWINSVCEVAGSDSLLARLVSGSLIVLKDILTFVITTFHPLVAKIPDNGANDGDKKTTEAKDKGDGGVR
jgi:hypothetical protein